MTNYLKTCNYQKMIIHDKITLPRLIQSRLNNIARLKNKNTVKLSPLVKQSRLSLKLIYYRKFSFLLKYIIYKIYIHLHMTLP